MSSVTIADIEATADRLEPAAIVQCTPVERSRSLSERCGADVHLKMEHLQRTGSFKTRGAERANIRTVRHERSRPDLPVGDADLVFEVETNGPAHVDRVLNTVHETGFGVEWTAQEGRSRCL